MFTEIYILLGIIIGLILGTTFCILVFLIVSKNKVKIGDLVDQMESPKGKAQFIEPRNLKEEFIKATSLKDIIK